MKVLYCLCGRSYRIRPCPLLEPEWIEREWFKAHRGRGHGRVDAITFARSAEQRRRWVMETGLRRKEVLKQAREVQITMELSKGRARS